MRDSFERYFMTDFHEELFRVSNNRVLAVRHAGTRLARPNAATLRPDHIPNLDGVLDDVTLDRWLELENATSNVVAGGPGDEITREWLKAQGYDGLYIENAYMGSGKADIHPTLGAYGSGAPGQNSYVVFDADQISMPSPSGAVGAAAAAKAGGKAPVSGGSGARERPTIATDGWAAGQKTNVKAALNENPRLAGEFREAAIRDVKPIEVTDAHRSIGKDIYVNTDAAFSIGDRHVMLVRKSDGTLQPFYKSTGSGTSPMTKATWLPFEGLQSTTGRMLDPTAPSGGVGIGRGWFIKTPKHPAGSTQGAADVHPREWLGVEDRAISERLSAVEKIDKMDWDALPRYMDTKAVGNEVEQINRLLGKLE